MSSKTCVALEIANGRWRLSPWDDEQEQHARSRQVTCRTREWWVLRSVLGCLAPALEGTHVPSVTLHTCRILLVLRRLLAKSETGGTCVLAAYMYVVSEFHDDVD